MKCFSDNFDKEVGMAAAGCCVARRFLPCLAAVLAAAALVGCGEGDIREEKKTDTAMGTIIQQNIYIRGEESAADDVMTLIDGLEKDLLSWRVFGSQVYQLNESAGKAEGMEVSRELWDILQTVWTVAEQSGGALDVTVGDVVRLWDIDSYAAGEKEGAFKVPPEEQIRQALADTGYERVSFEDGTVFLPERMNLDLGAVGKGIACARIQEYLKGREEVYGAVVSVGGSIATYGKKPDGSPWKVGILDPGNTGSYLGFLTLEGEWCVSTSGDYERFVEVDGIRYHHILDPSDGYPADSGVRSVTILTRDGLLGDALSTACFVLGDEKGLELAGKFGAEALVVDRDGSISMTDGMRKYFQG